jgi:uncharacterized protein (DUF433 family)
MLLEDYFDFFENPYAVRIKGRRIGLEHVVERYKDGQTAEQIAAYYGDLPLESIYAAILYYLHNREAVDTYLDEIDRLTQERIREARANPSPVARRMKAIKEQWEREGRFPREDPLPAR